MSCLRTRRHCRWGCVSARTRLTPSMRSSPSALAASRRASYRFNPLCIWCVLWSSWIWRKQKCYIFVGGTALTLPIKITHDCNLHVVFIGKIHVSAQGSTLPLNFVSKVCGDNISHGLWLSSIFLLSSLQVQSSTQKAQTQQAFVIRRNEVCFKFAQWRLTEPDGQVGISDLALRNFVYTKVNRDNDTWSHQVELGWVKVRWYFLINLKAFLALCFWAHIFVKLRMKVVVMSESYILTFIAELTAW